MNNQFDLNQIISALRTYQQQGMNPNFLMQRIVNQNLPINQMGVQFNNMCEGKSKNEALIQLAKQQGLTEENLNWIAQMLPKK